PFAFNDRGDTPAEDLIPMGPMPGPRMFPADGLPLQQEQQAAEQLGLTSDSFATQRHLGTGTRRRFAEFPGNTGADLLPDGAVEISFELPAGSFATVLLAELGAFSNWHPEKQSE
ncbi:MAG: tRNA pseudouridine(13) synthase TruD, partial [Planctomycetaceae bacterium]|nr:tRNA pseudouridine(13) synthase TruD [Planctomycetaceae bacterium]